MNVIYIDVLFVVNFFITFFLLLVTAKFSKRSDKLWRTVLASFIGGIYSKKQIYKEKNYNLFYVRFYSREFIGNQNHNTGSGQLSEDG